MTEVRQLFEVLGLGLMVLLPLANPLTTVALMLGLSGNMTTQERNQQSLMASVYVFIIMMVAYYAGQVVMNTFGISIPGLRIAGGLSSPSSASECFSRSHTLKKEFLSRTKRRK